jgi:hypothetical protein
LLQGFLRRRNRPSFSNLAEEDSRGLVASLLVCSRKQQARLANPPDSPCSPARPSSSLLQTLERKKKRFDVVRSLEAAAAAALLECKEKNKPRKYSTLGKGKN